MFDGILQQSHYCVLGFFPVSAKRASGGVTMAAPAEFFSDARNVNVAFRAQARAIDSGRALFQERDGFDAAAG